MTTSQAPDRPDRHEVGDASRPARLGVSGRVAAAYVLAVAGTAAIVLAAPAIRERVDPVATGFGFLVLVVAVSASAGSARGSWRACWGSPCSTSSSCRPTET